MYRPTIRCADIYKDYLDSLADVTGLDRNQLIRLALFSAPFSNLFIAQVEQKAVDVPIPSPIWKVYDHDLWLEQDPKQEKGGMDVNAKCRRTEAASVTPRNDVGRRNSEGCEQPERQQSEARQSRQVPSQRVIRDQGGVTIKIN